VRLVAFANTRVARETYICVNAFPCNRSRVPVLYPKGAHCPTEYPNRTRVPAKRRNIGGGGAQRPAGHARQPGLVGLSRAQSRPQNQRIIQHRAPAVSVIAFEVY